MNRLVIAVSGVVAATLLWTADASARDYSGQYKSKVTRQPGDTVKAMVTIKKIGENIYTSETKYADFWEAAICFGEEERLSCGFGLRSDSFAYVGVSIYRPGEGGKLIGDWVETSARRPGKEVLTPVVEQTPPVGSPQ